LSKIQIAFISDSKRLHLNSEGVGLMKGGVWAVVAVGNHVDVALAAAATVRRGYGMLQVMTASALVATAAPPAALAPASADTLVSDAAPAVVAFAAATAAEPAAAPADVAISAVAVNAEVAVNAAAASNEAIPLVSAMLRVLGTLMGRKMQAGVQGRGKGREGGGRGKGVPRQEHLQGLSSREPR
jgi:hypothetical protein